MHVAAYKHVAYISIMHLASALVRKVNAFSTDTEFAQLYS